MSENVGGLKGKVQKQYPCALCMHCCYSHVLSFVLQQS